MIFTVGDIIQEFDYWTIYALVNDGDFLSNVMGIGVFCSVNPKGQWINAEEILI